MSEEAIPSANGQEAGYTLDRSLVYYRDDIEINNNSHSHAHLREPVHLSVCLLTAMNLTAQTKPMWE